MVDRTHAAAVRANPRAAATHPNGLQLTARRLMAEREKRKANASAMLSSTLAQQEVHCAQPGYSTVEDGDVMEMAKRARITAALMRAPRGWAAPNRQPPESQMAAPLWPLPTPWLGAAAGGAGAPTQVHLRPFGERAHPAPDGTGYAAQTA
jgi:hypothetical protein